MIPTAFACLAAAASVALGDWCNRRLIGWLPDDPPRPGRKQHGRPMPLAGLLLLPAIVPWLVADRAYWSLAAIAVAAAVGFADDRRKEAGNDLGALAKGCWLFAAAALAALGVADPIAQPMRFGLIVALVFVITNATNFLDNTDGVAAGLSATSLLLVGGAGWPAAAGFAALGFVPWCWPRPRVFLGDSGAYALGIAAGTATAAASQHDPTRLLAVGVQLLDFAQVIAARIWIGVAPWIGDRRHLTHIVQNLGWPRPATAPLFVALALGLWQCR